VWGLFMFLYLLFVLWRGHGWVCLNVFLAQVEIFREMVNVRYHNREKEVAWFRSVQWAWFCVAVIYFYGGPLIKVITLSNDVDWQYYERQHRQIAFCVYAAVFVATVLVFKKGEYRYQMNQLAWTLLTIIMVVAQMQSVILNAFRGLIWFVVPTMLVVINDSMAYFAGFSMGKKIIDHEKYPFLKLSPNKTWEGFIGGGVATVFVGYYLPTLFMGHEWFVCPPKEIGLLPVEDLRCDIGPEFQLQQYTVPVAGPVRWLPGLIGMEEATTVYSSVSPDPGLEQPCRAFDRS
jgi:phosphatidate cytidylyltransferase